MPTLCSNHLSRDSIFMNRLETNANKFWNIKPRPARAAADENVYSLIWDFLHSWRYLDCNVAATTQTARHACSLPSRPRKAIKPNSGLVREKSPQGQQKEKGRHKSVHLGQISWQLFTCSIFMSLTSILLVLVQTLCVVWTVFSNFNQNNGQTLAKVMKPDKLCVNFVRIKTVCLVMAHNFVPVKPVSRRGNLIQRIISRSHLAAQKGAFKHFLLWSALRTRRNIRQEYKRSLADTPRYKNCKLAANAGHMLALWPSMEAPNRLSLRALTPSAKTCTPHWVTSNSTNTSIVGVLIVISVQRVSQSFCNIRAETKPVGVP